MTPVKCIQRPRRIATAMLFVWLLATFASWAHACLVPPSAATANLRGHHLQTGGAHDPDPARQACASFCETGQSFVAKAQPAKADSGADALMPLPVAIAGWPAPAVRRTEPRWRPLAAPPPPGLPVAIAFLRLTL
jgi:hypothetical protein